MEPTKFKEVVAETVTLDTTVTVTPEAAWTVELTPVTAIAAMLCACAAAQKSELFAKYRMPLIVLAALSCTTSQKLDYAMKWKG